MPGLGTSFGRGGLIAAAALIKGQYELARMAMWAAGLGAIVSPVLLTVDLGRPSRFINMLRVFKFQSPMSIGSWIVAGFGACAVPGLALVQWQGHNLGGPSVPPAVQVLIYLLVGSTGIIGIFLATYTGALISVTAVPAWNEHRLVLPFHFGMAGLGSAAAILEATSSTGRARAS